MSVEMAYAIIKDGAAQSTLIGHVIVIARRHINRAYHVLAASKSDKWQDTPDRLQEARVVATGYLFAALFFLGGCAFVLGGLMTFGIINGFLLKGRRRAPSKYDTYESGETPLGSAWVQFPLAFYVFALLFVVFDVDIVFILSWAVIFQQLGWFGFVEIVFFIVVLALGLVYAWRKGVIRWI